jgi:hypothetical protein
VRRRGGDEVEPGTTCRQPDHDLSHQPPPCSSLMSTRSSWTSHVTSQQAELDARQRADDDRLLLVSRRCLVRARSTTDAPSGKLTSPSSCGPQEIEAARRAREARRVAKYGRVGEAGPSTDRSLSGSSGGGSSSRAPAGPGPSAALLSSTPQRSPSPVLTRLDPVLNVPEQTTPRPTCSRPWWMPCGPRRAT